MVLCCVVVWVVFCVMLWGWGVVHNTGAFSGTAEAQYYINNLRWKEELPQGALACDDGYKGVIMRQDVAIITTGQGTQCLCTGTAAEPQQITLKHAKSSCNMCRRIFYPCQPEQRFSRVGNQFQTRADVSPGKG